MFACEREGLGTRLVASVRVLQIALRGHISCDFTFDCIPFAHENRARVSRPFLPRAGDVIHPALRNRRGLDTRLGDHDI